ncbi:ornithine aminotransferase [Verticillium alfalfae VaMs.102]|uniref:Ornithine aminotransferase n=1 Tax=Verticillium alfalfae (strain VaMs.102 / ATCC MYA-4576 / FGSC 10136) TaxID=526221 RepID=C9SP61_VERA1|nr:ornithine aminotransferase [Verticillium alfalfae VaMs.102]EEY20576.1 ornithine aminotransferase [Verticillium alfalfae VaMs.102]
MAPHADSPSGTSAATPSKYHAASTDGAIKTEEEYAAHNYHPLPVVFARGSGVHVWDPEGRQYLDFLSAYSAVNQGHCHPELVKALADQAGRLTLSSRAFYNDVFPRWAEKVRDVFGYDMVLPMNTGAEAVETAIKIARKWAYKVKGVEKDKALVFSVEDNFHGRTMTAISLSTDPESRDNYGPYVPGIGAFSPSTGKPIRYNNIADLEEVLEAHGKETARLHHRRGKGLLNAVVIDESGRNGRTAWDLCILLKEKGLLAKPTHGNIIRFAPPLVISETDLRKAIDTIGEALKELPNVKKAAGH